MSDTYEVMHRVDSSKRCREMFDALLDPLEWPAAEQHDDVVLWAFDRDYRVIADVTGQPTELESTSD